MAKKKGEEAAWEEYLASIEEKPVVKGKKGKPFGERLKELFSRIGFKRKTREEKELEKQVGISAAEGKKISEKELAPEEAVAHEPVEKEHLIIEDYFAKMEEQRKLEEKLAVKENFGKSLEGAKKAREGLEISGEEAGKPGIAGKGAAQPVPKKILFLPKGAAKKKKQAEEIEAAKKKGKAAAEGKVSKPAQAAVPVQGEALAKFFMERPSIAKKTVKEIKRLSPEEIKKEVRFERIARKAAGWYGEALRHKKAAMSGWRIRKKVRLHQLKAKEKKGKLSAKEAMQKKELIAEDRGLSLKIDEVDAKIRALKKVSLQKKREGALLEKKVRSIGVEIPKAEPGPVERGRAKFKERGEVIDIVEAMMAVADKVAAGASKQTMADVSLTEALTIDEQISAQQKLIQGLETAFYKRKIDFNQFREKMFEYQAKLSEMKIKKKISEQRLASMSPEMRAMLLQKEKAAIGPGTGAPREGILHGAARPLERMAAAPKPLVDEKLAEAMKKIAEQEVKRAAEKTEEKRFAERTADALQKIAEKLASIQRPEQPAVQVHQWMPPPAGFWGKGYRGQRPERQKEKFAPKREESEEEYVPPKKPARKPEEETGDGGYKKIRREIEKAEEEEAKAEKKAAEKTAEKMPEKEKREAKIRERAVEKAVEKEKREAKIRERIIERIVEKAPEKEIEPPKGKISQVLDSAIREKLTGSGASKDQIDKIEERLGELLEKYHIPDTALATHISTLNSGRLVQDFQKLINLIESRKEEAAAELIRPAAGFDISTGIISKKKEKIVGKEKDIKMTTIETTFDRLLNLVQVKGILTLDEAAKELALSRKQVQECAEILESSKLIKLNYPPIGPVKLIYPEYLKWKEEEKKKAVALKKSEKHG